MEYLEDYNFDLQYHPGKANVIADALVVNRVVPWPTCLFKIGKCWDTLMILGFVAQKFR